MAVKSLVRYPNSLLREISTKIEVFNLDFQLLVDNLIDTMFAEDSMGLAAPQIGELKRVFVLNPKRIAGNKSRNYQQKDILCIVNPQIENQDCLIDSSEGCLSFPGRRETVKRFNQIRIKALNRENQVFYLDAQGMLSILIQHEIDHLNGILLIDR
ncbi:MAG: peptide deformylase [Richelia sp. RM2_1_2]|nr:peptide deformylase [Richelia sp. SM2_1_7]NJM20192.1 peptide deformylase [Richelia sp. SM1_7_0]NJN12514.1 peptide deformylase [Richelia sp. RM1_1_1]NJO30821.1 peptide deformylase [Richelia sp. SL_2_1]NJO63225.1 peptide deformylase [Richelia sp. RM2_1_2]